MEAAPADATGLRARWWPSWLLHVALVLTAVLFLGYFGPRAMAYMEQVNATLPGLTRSLLSAAQSLRGHGAIVLALLAVFLVGDAIVLRQLVLRARWLRVWSFCFTLSMLSILIVLFLALWLPFAAMTTSGPRF